MRVSASGLSFTFSILPVRARRHFQKVREFPVSVHPLSLSLSHQWPGKPGSCAAFSFRRSFRWPVEYHHSFSFTVSYSSAFHSETISTEILGAELRGNLHSKTPCQVRKAGCRSATLPNRPNRASVILISLFCVCATGANVRADARYRVQVRRTYVRQNGAACTPYAR